MLNNIKNKKFNSNKNELNFYLKIIEYYKFLKKNNLTIFLILLEFYSTIKKNLKILKKRKKLKLKSIGKFEVTNSIDNLKIRYKRLYELKNRSNSISSPSIINSTSSYELLNGDIDNVNIFFLFDCYSYSRSISISNNTSIYNNILYKHERIYDIKNPLMEEISSYDNKEMILYINNNLLLKDDFTYIHLLNDHSNNYFHWLYEIMPRILMINDLILNDINLKKEEYTILVDDELPKQFLEILDLCIDFKHNMLLVQRYSRVKCKRLIYCDNLWTSLDNTKYNSDIKKEFFVDNYAVELVYKRFKKFCIVEKPFRKIYFERKKTQARNLINNKELKDYLLKNDFEIIVAESLTFEEQIKLFQESKIIIGVSGAVFSNIIFMKEHTNAVILSPNTKGSNYYIFQQMADVSNVKLEHVLTVKSEGEDLHKASYIDINIIKNTLNNRNKD